MTSGLDLTPDPGSTIHSGDILMTIRCAIHTRKSSEEGLAQAFNFAVGATGIV